MKIIVDIGTNDDIQISAYCLTTDSWQDYLSFLEESRTAFHKADKRKGNRALRAAILSLFSHLEGVLNNICKYIGVWDKIKNRPISYRINYIDGEAKKHATIPNINFRLGKCMRDVLTHPGIEKAFEIGRSVDEISVYEELTIESLDEIGAMLDKWLLSV